MNVLIITPDFNYACGRSYYAYLLSKYLRKKGHNVILLTNRGDSFDRLDKIDTNYYIIKSLHSNILFTYTKNISKIIEIIKNHNIDIVHTLHRKPELLAVAASKKIRRKVKTVHTALSLVSTKYNVEFKSDSIISISDCIDNMLLSKFKIKSDKIFRIPIMIEDEENAVTEVIVNAGDKKIILAIGRFHKDKNFVLILNAMKSLDNKNLKLVLIGEGNELKKYIEIIQLNELDVDIIKPQKYLKYFYEISDICILPSKNEPFPTFMLQAGLYKKLFIGSNIDGMKEMIKDGKNGLLFESNNYVDLSDKINYAILNPEISKSCALNLNNDVNMIYSPENVVNKIINVYQKLLNVNNV